MSSIQPISNYHYKKRKLINFVSPVALTNSQIPSNITASMTSSISSQIVKFPERPSIPNTIPSPHPIQDKIIHQQSPPNETIFDRY